MMSFLSHSAFGVGISPEMNHPITITINEEPLDTFTQPHPSRYSFKRFACLFKRNRKIQPVIQTEVNIEYRQLDHNNYHLIREIVGAVKKLYFNEIIKIKAANSLDEGRLSEIEELHSESYEKGQDRCISVPPNYDMFSCDNKSYMVVQEGHKKFRVYRDSSPVRFSRLNNQREFDTEQSPSEMLGHQTREILPRIIRPIPVQL